MTSSSFILSDGAGNDDNVRIVAHDESVTGLQLPDGTITTLRVLAGGTAAATVIGEDAILEIQASGTADGARILDGGQLTVAAGGAADGIEQQIGARVNVAVYGDDTATRVAGTNANGAFSIAGGIAENVAVYGSGLPGEETPGGTPDNADGYQKVFAGGLARNTHVYAGGRQEIHTGASAEATVVEVGGTLSVATGGQATGVVQRVGGNVLADVNATQANTQISGTNANGAFSLARGIAENFILYGTSQLVTDGGTANRTTVSGGTQTLRRRAAANDTLLLGGTQQVYADTTATGTVIREDGRQNVYDRGNAADTAVENGTQLVLNGRAVRTTVGAAGRQLVAENGRATNTTLTGGTQRVYAGGTAVDTVVQTGGSQRVEAGSTAERTDVRTGGEQYVAAGGAVSDLTLAVGARSTLEAGVTLSGSISVAGNLTLTGAVNGDAITVSARLDEQNAPAETFLIDGFRYLDDADEIALTVSAGQNFGQYKLFSGLDDDTPSLSLVDTDKRQLGSLSDTGEALRINDRVYRLEQNGGNLYLTVSEAVDAPDDDWTSPELPEIVIGNTRPEYEETVIAGDRVAPDDPVDYRKLTLIAPGRYDFELTGLTGAAKLVLYTIATHPRTGVQSLKQYKTLSVVPRTVRGNYINSGEIDDLLLDAGSYILAVQNVGKSETGYSVAVEADLFLSADSSDNDWKTLAGSAQIIVPGDSDTLNTSLINRNWVGFGDAVDYRQLTLENAGSYRFTLGDLEAAAKLTVYSVVTNAKTGVQSLRQLKTLTVAPRTVRGERINSGALPAMLLDAGTYYFAVQATGAALGKNTGYSVQLDGSVFNRTDNSDDNWQSLGEDAKITVPGDQATYAATLLEDNWVGYGDAVDYRRLTLENAGSYRFTLDDLEAAAKLTVYSVVTNARTGVRSLRQLKTLTVAPRQLKGEWIKSGTMPAILLDAGTYYFAVQATGAALGKNTGYSVRLDGSVFNRADNSDDNWQSLGEDAQITVPGLPVNRDTAPLSGLHTDRAVVDVDDAANYSGTLIDDNWVGYGDTIDYRQLTLEAAGEYTFTLSGLENTARLSLYSVVTHPRTGVQSLKQIKTLTVVPRQLKGEWIDSGEIRQLLTAGTYYVAVQAPGAATGKNTGYSVRLDGDLFLKGDNSDDRWQDAANWQTRHEIADWVGYGDAVDFRSFSIDADAAGVYSFTLDGDFNEVSMTLYRRNYDRNGNEINPVSLGAVTNLKRDGQSGWNTLTRQLLAGDYYLAVKSTDNGRGAKNSDYTVSVTADTFGTIDAGDTLNLTLAARSSRMLALNVARAGQLTLDDASGAAYSLYRNVNNNLVAIPLRANLVLEAGTYYLKAANNTRQQSDARASLAFSAFPEIEYGTLQTACDLGEVTSSDGLSLENWVGLGNGTDYYTFSTGDVGFWGLFGFSSDFDFETGKEAAAHDCTLKISVGTLQNGVFRQIAGKSFTVADTLSGNETRYKFKASLAANTTYVVRVETPDGGKGGFNSDYRAYVAPYLYSNDNSFEAARQLGDLADLAEEQYFATVATGDPVDYYHFTAHGLYSIGARDPYGAIRVTLYDQNRKVLGVKTSAGWRSASDAAVFSEFALDGAYYLKVEATGAMSDYYLQANRCDVTADNTADTAADLGVVSSWLSGNGWIGDADRADCRRFTLTDSCRTEICLDGLANKSTAVLRLSVWDEAGRQVGPAVTITGQNVYDTSWQQDLAGGTYVMKVEQVKGSSNYNLYGSFEPSLSFAMAENALSGMDQAVTPQAAFSAAALSPEEEERLASGAMIA